MKFKIDRADYKRRKECPTEGPYKVAEDAWSATWHIEVESLADLIDLMKREEEGIILYPPSHISADDLPEITIYDSYVE